MKPVEQDNRMGLDRWCEALDWYATLRGADAMDLTQAVGRDWQQWYAIPENRSVFDAVSRLMAASTLYRRRRRAGTAHRRDDRYDPSWSIAEWRRAEAERTKPRHHRRVRAWWRTPGGLAVAAISLVLALWPLRFRAGRSTTHTVTYETGPDGLKQVDLSDGSHLILGQRTRLTVAYSARQRSVKLIEGQVWFKVEHDPQWPFVVSAGDGTIRDAGTAFLVKRESNRILVTVMDGRVEVSTRQPVWGRIGHAFGFATPLALTRVAVTGGEQLAIGDDGVLGRITHTNAHASHGCACRPLIFDNKTLRQVTGVLSVYSSQEISVDPAAGALRLSGIVFPGEILQWLRSLQHSLPVTVEQQGRVLRIRMRPAESLYGTQSRGGQS